MILDFNKEAQKLSYDKFADWAKRNEPKLGKEFSQDIIAWAKKCKEILDWNTIK